MVRIKGLAGRTLAVLAALGLGVLAVSHQGEAQVTKGKTRPAETKFLMRGGVQPHCKGCADLVNKGPADDKAWETLLCHASVLNELGHALMQDGRCPDKTWAEAAKTLQECSSKLVEAARAKNGDDAKTAFKGLTGACAACHKAHKGKKS